jgi:polyribonucleotide nucleotidyltransferase
MELKEYLVIGLGLLGWFWGIIQFRLNRKFHKSDKILEKRFDVYSNFMNQMDEMSLKMRTDPNAIYGIQNDLMAELLTEDSARINNALLEFNSRLLENTKRSSQSMMMVNQELNKLKLVASKKLLPKISEYKTMVNDFTNDFDEALKDLKDTNDLDRTAKELNKMVYKEDRNNRFKELWEEIEMMMREEIGYYKN